MNSLFRGMPGAVRSRLYAECSNFPSLIYWAAMASEKLEKVISYGYYENIVSISCRVNRCTK